jgi:hypothetical protein
MALLVTDPVCFRRDANGDLKFPLELARGLEAVAIGIRTRVLLFAGEWFLNMLAGVKWLPSRDGVTVPEREALLGQHFDEVKTRRELRREILTTPGVIALPTLDVSFDNAARTLEVGWVARTAFGDTPPDAIRREF